MQRRLYPLLLVGPLLGLGSVSASAMSFTRITEASNPIVSDGGHPAPHYYGASWIDFDQDDDLDLFVDLDALYRNDGGGTFTRLLGTGLGDGQFSTPAFSMSGVSWGDYDNDGDPDAFIAGEASYLYRNDGLSGFTRITTGAIGGGVDNRGWTCAWGDYDNDGNLDLVIIHPAGFVPPSNLPLENKLFLSDGPPDYTFTEITTGPIVEGFDSYTVGTWSDYDDDGDIDFFIGSGPASGTFQPDNLYRNLLVESGDADFERITEAPIGTDDQDGQVWNWIDYDNDGDLDAYLTNWGGTQGGLANRLYRQEDNGSFTAVTGQPIADEVRVSLASVWEDFDNDGDLDCYVGNDGNSFDSLFENNGDGTFVKITSTPVTTLARPRRGATAGDYDNDGDIDLFVNGPTNSRALYRNDEASGNGWLDVCVFGTDSNRSGIGAKIRVKATIGGSPVWQRRDINGQDSFNGHNAQVAHFGLGDATSADSVVVAFPSGEVTIATDIAANQKIRLGEGDVSSAPGLSGEPVTRSMLQLLGPTPFRDQTALRFDLAESGPTEVSIHDALGRRVRTLVSGVQRAGVHQLEWDGRNDQGRELSAGVYTVRILSAGGTHSEPVVLVR